MSVQLHEASSKLAKNGHYWDATLISPGKGSSGIYAESMLREYGPTAFPKGTHSYVDHPRDENDTRSPKNLIGVLAEDARYVEGRGLVAKLEVMPHFAEFVEAVAPHTGLSIYAIGDGQQTDDGYMVESLLPDIFNTVDLVSYAGRGGELAEKLLESAVQTSVEKLTDDGPAPADGRKPQSEEYHMDIEDLAKKVDTLQESLKALTDVVIPLAESLKPVEPTEETDFAAVAEAAIKAGLPEESRAVVYESARNGADADEAIAKQKALVESIIKSVSTEPKHIAEGRVIEGAGDSLLIGKWGRK